MKLCPSEVVGVMSMGTLQVSTHSHSQVSFHRQGSDQLWVIGTILRCSQQKLEDVDSWWLLRGLFTLLKVVVSKGIYHELSLPTRHSGLSGKEKSFSFSKNLLPNHVTILESEFENLGISSKIGNDPYACVPFPMPHSIIYPYHTPYAENLDLGSILSRKNPIPFHIR